MALFDFMNTNKVELLAPAGNMEGFLGAIHAGADAVYLGGEKFGARAYADNFSDEEVCQAIRYAHLFHKKVYMTVNTLLKDTELSELIPYMTPFYMAGLDGVIVQDLGAFSLMREAFPDLPMHVSTQMTVTGSFSSAMLKELGAVRIVPARELSLAEIKHIKAETGLEMETFIHGAMCYCYSGQCLFSSILGGRSGNRGRCAQPCRLPYEVKNGDKQTSKEQYPLSLKDMCTISLLPKLIDAGIDSFKIEGRMKKPEYTAGVTAIYRKYIDLYYEKGIEAYQVSREDFKTLSSLYIRSQIQEGYYFKQNGKEMVTLDTPAYNGSDDALLAAIREKYIEHKAVKNITMKANFCIGKPAEIILQTKDTIPRKVILYGDRVEQATKQPVTLENVKKGLLKLGNTAFAVADEDMDIFVEDGIFYPLRSINELRRMATEQLMEVCAPGRSKPGMPDVVKMENVSLKKPEPIKQAIHLLATTGKQVEAILQENTPFSILYLESEMDKLSVSYIQSLRETIKSDVQIYIALPYIVRQKDLKMLSDLYPLLKAADGCLVRNMESFAWLQEKAYPGAIRTDANVYCFNQKTIQFWLSKATGACIPYELNKAEVRALLKDMDTAKLEQVVYGRIPLMVTANCIEKTSNTCVKCDHTLYLKDRYQKEFPVTTHCAYCYNVIYNSVPLSFHDKVHENKISTPIRLSFTLESKEETKAVLDFFFKDGYEIPYREYTLGHEKRGVE